MKLIDLEINNLRGIKNITLSFRGANAVVWGPNASGKSAVVDALDFLFTGGITRLTGPGTGDLSLARHGPHVDSTETLRDSWVRATVQTAPDSEPITIRRCLEDPATLVVDPQHALLLEGALAIAKRGHHLLTRRQILNFITSQASERAEQMQELLNLRDIETARSNLVTVEGRAQRQHESCQHVVNDAAGEVLSVTSLPSIEPALLLALVNQKRGILGGQPLDNLLASHLKAGIQPPRTVQVTPVPATAGAAEPTSINTSILKDAFQTLADVLEKREFGNLGACVRQLDELLRQSEQDANLIHELKHHELVLMGIDLLEDSGECPLCLTPWGPGLLRELLENRRSTAERAVQLTALANQAASQAVKLTTALLATVARMDTAATVLKMDDAHGALSTWMTQLTSLRESLKEPFRDYRVSPLRALDISSFLAPASLPQVLQSIVAKADEELPRTSPEQDAWDFLTELTRTLDKYERAGADCAIAAARYDRSQAVRQLYEASRDAVLKALYDEICNRFVELYRTIHGEDEGDFSAHLGPRGAGVTFEVSFFGRGVHPPHALHSEGHQDSMGICLFLALAERLGEGLFDIIVLDDVVMSVDRHHRRAVCNVLKESFPDKQFIITTHEQFWAYELRAAGVVAPKGMFEFYNWTIESGPKLMQEATSLQRVRDELSRGNVDGAVQALRKTTEHFFALAGENIEARVALRLNADWDLGQLASGTKGRLNELLAKAKEAANSWGDTKTMGELRTYADNASAIFESSQLEQWALNPIVHFNNWALLSPGDFAPVLDSFENLFSLFESPKCRSLLFLSRSNGSIVGVRCSCANIHWNLTKKGE